MEYSISPNGEKFKIPDEEDYKKEYQRLEDLAKRTAKRGRRLWWSWASGLWARSWRRCGRLHG